MKIAVDAAMPVRTNETYIINRNQYIPNETFC